jgi:hypothetical protein
VLFAEYNQNGQVKEDEMGRAYNALGGKEKLHADYW